MGIHELVVGLQLLSAALVCAGLAYSVRLRDDATTWAFRALLVICLSWNLLYGMEINLDLLSQRVLIIKFRVVTTYFIGVAVLALVGGMVGNRRLLTRKNIILLSILPVSVSVVSLTQWFDPHVLYDLEMVSFGDHPVLIFKYGPLYNLQNIYNYALLAVAFLLLYGHISYGKTIYMFQGLAFAGAIALPLIVGVAFELGVTPMAGYDFTSATLAVSCALLLISLVKFRLFELRPTTRNVVLEDIPDAVIMFDDGWRLADFNKAASSELDLTGKGMLGKDLSDVFDQVPEFVERCHSERTFQEEVALTTRSEQKTYEASVRCVSPDEGGSGRIVILRDITMRRLAEDLLRQSEERYRMMIEMAPFPIAITRKADGTVILINRLFEEQFRVRRSDAVDRPSSQFYADIEDRKRLISVVLPGGAVEGREVHLKAMDGRTFWAYVAVTEFEFEGEAAYFAAFHDVTDRRRAEDALRTTNMKLNLLSSVTRHDLLNKITTIQSLVYVAVDEDDRARLRDLMDKLSKEVTVAESIISFTRDYQELGTAEPVWQSARLLLDQAASQLDLGEARLSNRLGETEVMADRLLAKVFHNLVGNSLSHGERITEITASAERRGRDLVIVFQDNGIGVPAQNKERIFEKGFGRHTGLGLYLAREILAITGITIKECGIEGVGARFEMTVPEGSFRDAKD